MALEDRKGEKKERQVASGVGGVTAQRGWNSTGQIGDAWGERHVWRSEGVKAVYANPKSIEVALRTLAGRGACAGL
jgi:hypothetical protein